MRSGATRTPLPRSSMRGYQGDASRLLVHTRRQAVLLKMGLGKTVITLTALCDLGLARTLVVAPAKVVERDVWGEEARQWQHLSDVQVVNLVGDERRRMKLLESKSRPRRVDVVSYELVRWLSGEMDLESRYQAIVFDELSKMKHPGSQRFRRLRTCSMGVPIRFGLTGSPVGNHLLDLWGELFMVAGEAPFGPSYSAYRDKYFCPSGYGPYSGWELRHPIYEDEIHVRAAPWAFSLDAKLAAEQLPEVLVSPVSMELPASVRKIEQDLEKKCRTELASGASLVALSASTYATKARQLASGAVYITDEDGHKIFAEWQCAGDTKTCTGALRLVGASGAVYITDEDGQPLDTWEEVHRLKLDALQEILDEQQGDGVLCFYWYEHDLVRLRQAFPFAREASEGAALDDWCRRKVPLLLAHPQSTGHGLNLQSGGSTAAWFTLPWSHELWEQGNARLARIGQECPFVTAIPLLAGATDRMVLEVLQSKGAVQAALMSALEM